MAAARGDARPVAPQAFYMELAAHAAPHTSVVYIGDTVEVEVPRNAENPVITMRLVFVACWVCVTTPPV